jgi:4-amino-4-deoxy-L-arabinose transferase-like glycosyltransferase
MDTKTKPTANPVAPPTPLETGTGGWKQATFLIAGICLLALVRSLPWSLFNGYDQAKQAFTSLEMIRDGVWWYPHLPTGLYATKPPLMGWLSAGLYSLTGWWEGAWRLPSFAAFAGALFLLFAAGRKIAGSPGGYVVAAAFGLNMLSLRVAGLVRTDMLLALWILLAGLLIWTRVRKGSPWNRREQLCFAGLVLASLFTKGPVLPAFLLPSLAVFHLMERRGTRPHAWPGTWTWVLPFLLFSLWVVIGSLRDPQFHQLVVVREFLGNLKGGGHGVTGANNAWQNWASPLTYPAQLLHRLFPWSIALLLWWILDRKGRQRLLDDAGARWIVIWFGCGLVIMSLVPGKRADRIFPVVLPLSILWAYVIRHASWNPAWRLTRCRAVQCLTIIAATVWGGYTVYNQLINLPHDPALGLRRFCDRVLAWEQLNGRPAVIVGPVSDDDQALPVYLRQTKCPDLAQALAGTGHGQTALIVPEDRIPELDRSGLRYRIVETQTSTTSSGHRHLLVTTNINQGPDQ